jgi:hypothetical protein
MQQAWLSLFFLFATTGVLPAQVSTTPANLVPQPPQTARQALIEMFFGKDANDFAKHLPDEARQTLIRNSENPQISAVLRFASLGRELAAQGEHLETFDVGPNILVAEQPERHQKVEVVVEHDSYLGDEEEIELSFRLYENGQLESLPVIPTLTFGIKQEKDIWRVSEVSATAHVPLSDPEYLKGLRKQQDESNESSAQMRISMIAGGEKHYASKHPDRGYSCKLATVFAPESGVAVGEGGFVYDPGGGSEEWNGYRFSLSGCDQPPASRYRVLAIPLDADSEMKTFCTDETGAVRSQVGSNSSACFSNGDVLSQGSASQ